MSRATCPYASSGCNYPEGQCVEFCIPIKMDEPVVTPTDAFALTQLLLMIALAMSLGAGLALLFLPWICTL